MEEPRKRARNAGNDEIAGAPAVTKARQSSSSGDASAATKIAELQVELDTLKQIHKVAVYDLNAKVASQLREIKGLNSALHWAYATERTTRQHWIERGHSEDYADAVINLLSRMKEIIENLRVGGKIKDEDIDINFDLLNEDGNCIHADHDELLVPYWKEFASGLRHWSEYHAGDKSLNVYIRCVEMPKVVLDILRPAFEQSRIKFVYFDTICHTGDMADFTK